MLKISLDDLINVEVGKGRLIGWPAEQDPATGEIVMIEPKVSDTVSIKISILAKTDILPPEGETEIPPGLVEPCKENFIRGFKDRIMTAVIHDIQGGPVDYRGYQIHLQPGIEKLILIIAPEQYAEMLKEWSLQNR